MSRSLHRNTRGSAIVACPCGYAGQLPVPAPSLSSQDCGPIGAGPKARARRKQGTTPGRPQGPTRSPGRARPQGEPDRARGELGAAGAGGKGRRSTATLLHRLPSSAGSAVQVAQRSGCLGTCSDDARRSCRRALRRARHGALAGGGRAARALGRPGRIARLSSSPGRRLGGTRTRRRDGWGIYHLHSIELDE